MLQSIHKAYGPVSFLLFALFLSFFLTLSPGPSRNRHQLYCQKKLGANIPVLRKSCAACRKAKAKCNSEFPSCRRCDGKGLACVYELTRRSVNVAQQPNSGGTLPTESSELENGNEISWDIIPDDGNGIFNVSENDLSHYRPTTQEDLSCQGILPLEWEPDVGFIEELENSNLPNYSSTDFQTAIDWFSSAPTQSLTLDPTFSTPADCMFHTPYLILRPMDYDHPPPSSSLISPRSPFIHAYLSPSSHIGRAFLLQNIQSYATVLATSALPPFIHNTSLPLPNPTVSQIPTCSTPPSQPALEICKSIISLYTAKTPSTSSFIWRTITMEKDRFMNEYLDGDEWTVLSMLQAITLYILLRIFDHDSFSVDFDRELVRAMTVRELISFTKIIEEFEGMPTKLTLLLGNRYESRAVQIAMLCRSRRNSPRVERMGIGRVETKDSNATLHTLSSVRHQAGATSQIQSWTLSSPASCA
jgi:hypothetical protein